jgi:hypothetical protein
VFVRNFAEAPGSPKLLVPCADPYVVEARNERIFRERTPSGIVQVNSDRVTKSPRPEDLPENVRYREPDDESGSESDADDVGDTQDYVLDRLVGHEMRNSQLYLKVRWYGYEAADDTWELWPSVAGTAGGAVSATASCGGMAKADFKRGRLN